jgi:hypothetical protein
MIKGTLYINDNNATVDVIHDHEFDSKNLQELKKEIKKMSKELKKENSEWWYQGEVEIEGKEFSIEDTEITED